jgi:predicted nuclease of predicted toxin-antitoxin system
MRFIADENFPGEAVAVLRASAHDVRWISEEASGASDEQVLALAESEGRVLLTFDKDFGELAWRAGLPASCGIVLFRISAPSASIGAALAARIAERDDWAGHFSVIEPGRVRMRALRGVSS